MTDELIIARWYFEYPELRSTSALPLWNPEILAHVEDAMIDRGHAEEYGRELLVRSLPTCGAWINLKERCLSMREVARLATLDHSTRIAALAAVIRGMEEPNHD